MLNIPMKLTLGELITIGTLVVGITTGFVTISNDVAGLKEDVSAVYDKLDSIELEQYRMNAVLNYLYGEGFRSGWSLPKNYADGVLKELEELKEAQKLHKKK